MREASYGAVKEETAGGLLDGRQRFDRNIERKRGGGEPWRRAIGVTAVGGRSHERRHASNGKREEAQERMSA